MKILLKKLTIYTLIAFILLPIFNTITYAGGESSEFAKAYKWTVKNNAKGVQATITLPDSKTFKGDSDYFNFYIGIGDSNGKDSYECGISTCKEGDFRNTNGEYNWHWFVNDGNDKAIPKTPDPETILPGSKSMQFKDGDTIFLKLVLNKKGQLEFYVNQMSADTKPVYTSSKTFNSLPNARVVAACCQSDKNAEWGMSHSEVTFKNLMYKTTDNEWVYMTGGDKGNSVRYNKPWNKAAKKASNITFEESVRPKEDGKTPLSYKLKLG